MSSVNASEANCELSALSQCQEDEQKAKDKKQTAEMAAAREKYKISEDDHTVVAEFKVNGRELEPTVGHSPKWRGVRVLAGDEKWTKNEYTKASEYIKKNDKSRYDKANKMGVNVGTYSSHAEVEAMEKALKAYGTDGLKNGEAVMTVTGRNICGYCRDDATHLFKEMELKSMVVCQGASGSGVKYDRISEDGDDPTSIQRTVYDAESKVKVVIVTDYYNNGDMKRRES